MRMTQRSSESRGNVVRIWNPALPYSETGVCAVSPCRLLDFANTSDISISGLRISSDERSILASYHKDQIYIFDTAEGSSAEPGDERGGGARQCLGGHLNEKTFLKDVAFFGPNDEFVVSGQKFFRFPHRNVHRPTSNIIFIVFVQLF